ncbi:unnamed protein product [Gordionus sp. m RMFG-2023]|uniref:3'(2'),5'-bisphosphate nucleotidase 1-like n=1 Tax=Gordionus sp. m RMFG-2023 TaxID=3053472 RepID=UPI0030E2F5F3
MSKYDINCEMILKLLAGTVTAAWEAGNIIKNVLKQGSLNIVEKGLNDYQTEADRLSQRWIFNYLKYHFPKLRIIGEEDIAETPIENQEKLNSIEIPEAKKILSLSCPKEYMGIEENKVVIWVDPLDGTSEFTEGHLDHVTVLIGISYKGQAIAGAICQPFYQTMNSNNSKLKNTPNVQQDGRIIWGLQGLGAYGIIVQDPPKEKLIICTTQSHKSAIVLDAINSLKPDKVIHIGGCGMKVLLVIEGLAHAYLYASKGSKKWDTCAPEAILRALGGKLTDICGESIDYSLNSPPSETPSKTTIQDSHWVNNYIGILATHKGLDHAGLIKKIPQNIKDTLRMEGAKLSGLI